MGWRNIKLGEVSNLITKGASPKWQGINYVKDSSQVLFVTSENVRENFIDISKPKYLEIAFNEKQKRSILKKGDVLLNIVGASIGRAAIYNLDFNANINQAVAVIKLSDQILNKFVSYYLNSNKALSYYNFNKVDVARANLSLVDVANIELALPPLQEQQHIVEELESKLTVCDKIEETIIQSLQQAEILRQSILKRAFEGKLV
jgi:restriction endonuclease S subunit